MAQASPRGGEDRAPQGRVVPAGGLHRDEPASEGLAGRDVLQRAWHGRAVDQGGQERREVDAAELSRLRGQSGPRLQLFAPAYNLGNFLRRLALPRAVKHWSLTTLREKLIKIGAKVVNHARYVIFQMAKVAIPRRLFRAILERIQRLRPPGPFLYRRSLC